MRCGAAQRGAHARAHARADVVWVWLCEGRRGDEGSRGGGGAGRIANISLVLITCLNISFGDVEKSMVDISISVAFIIWLNNDVGVIELLI